MCVCVCVCVCIGYVCVIYGSPKGLVYIRIGKTALIAPKMQPLNFTMYI